MVQGTKAWHQITFIIQCKSISSSSMRSAKRCGSSSWSAWFAQENSSATGQPYRAWTDHSGGELSNTLWERKTQGKNIENVQETQVMSSEERDRHTSWLHGHFFSSYNRIYNEDLLQKKRVLPSVIKAKLLFVEGRDVPGNERTHASCLQSHLTYLLCVTCLVL